MANEVKWLTIALGAFLQPWIICPGDAAPQSESEKNADAAAQRPLNANVSGYVFPSTGERFRNYLGRSIGLGPLIAPAIQAATDQNSGEPGEWGQGAEGYAKRYGSWLGQNLITETTRYGLGEALRMDTTYRKCDCTGFFPRFGHAVLQAAIARRPDGRAVISLPTFVSPYAGGMISVYSWYPDRFSWKDGLRMGTIRLASEPLRNLFREFFRGR